MKRILTSVLLGIMLLGLLLLGGAMRAGGAGAAPVTPVSTLRSNPVLLVHGYNDNAGCAETKVASYWADTKAQLIAQGFTTVRTIGYYTCDVGADASIGSFTRDADIDDIGAALAAYIHRTYGNAPVDLVGHSMGGLIIRSAAVHDPSLNVAQAVTMSTPWDGAGTIASNDVTCSHTLQCEQFATDSPWLALLRSEPATVGDWSAVGGGPCDVLEVPSATDLPGAHLAWWTSICYSHMGYLSDTSKALNASGYTEQPGASAVYVKAGYHSIAFLGVMLRSDGL